MYRNIKYLVMHVWCVCVVFRVLYVCVGGYSVRERNKRRRIFVCV